MAKLSDGSEHAAHVLFTELGQCRREGTLVFVSARSKNYERCGAMTEAYTRALVAELTALLAELDAERAGNVVPIRGKGRH